MLCFNTFTIKVFVAATRNICSPSHPIPVSYILSSNSYRIVKGSKVEAVQLMPTPSDVSSLHSFLAWDCLCSFLPNRATVSVPLYRLTKEDVQWIWGPLEQAAFKKLKDMLTADTVDPSLPVGISCDASEVGLGAVPLHRYFDVS